MTKAIDLLFNEHELITKAIEQTHAFLSDVANGSRSIEEMHNRIHFFRNYADRYHHHKEEEILFPEMSKRNELLADGVIQEMLENHADFRDMLADIESTVNAGDIQTLQKQFANYAEALLDHIAVENDEVFHMAETLFSEDELDNIYYRFLDCDRELDEDNKREMEEAVEKG